MSSKQVITEMRHWLWITSELFERETVACMDDAEVIALVDDHYCGGKLAFVSECEWDAA